MKRLLMLFWGAVSLCAYTTSFAANPSDCLPIAQVAQAKFSRADGTFISSSNTLWTFISLPIFDHNKSWTVVFATILPSYEPSSFDAGLAAFHKTALIGPEAEETDGKLICQYAISADGINSVFAIHPAVDNPMLFVKNTLR